MSTETEKPIKTGGGFKTTVEKFFKLEENGTNIKTEVLAGITTFMTMAYIIVVNPDILVGVLPDEEKANMFKAFLFATVLVSSLMSIVMGIVSNNPYAVAPGMGLNAYIAYGLYSETLGYPQIFGAIVIAGAMLTIMSFTPISRGVLKAIPKSLRFGLAAGIGLFLTLIGLENAGVVVTGMSIINIPGLDPFMVGINITLGHVGLTMALFFIGLILTSILMIKKVPGAFLISIVATTILGVIFSIGGLGKMIDSAFEGIVIEGIIEMPRTDTFFSLSFKGLLEPALIIPIFTLAFTDLFDSVSTFLGVSEVGGLLDENGDPKNFKRTLIADSLTTLMSGFIGVSDATTYIESAAGVEQGGRTGLTAVIAGLCFLPFMFFSPLLAAIPPYATAPVLVLLGVLMFKPLSSLDWSNYEEAIPAFLAATIIPFTYSITYGIVFSIIVYVLIKILLGKFKEINAWLWVTFVFALFALLAPLF
jgi:AGZA family xanthine/uracil permease-like MFS transporter